jgi:hypothetical protein
VTVWKIIGIAATSMQILIVQELFILFKIYLLTVDSALSIFKQRYISAGLLSESTQIVIMSSTLEVSELKYQSNEFFSEFYHEGDSTRRLCTSYVPSTHRSSTFPTRGIRDRCGRVLVACTTRKSWDIALLRAGSASLVTISSSSRAKDVRCVVRRTRARDKIMRTSYAPTRIHSSRSDNNSTYYPSCTSTCRNLHKLSPARRPAI